MAILFQKFIHREDLRTNPDYLYLFGDNEQRIGQGGQAREMRGEPNAVGIRTKRTPGTDETAYWAERTSDEFIRNCSMLNEDFLPVWKALREDQDLIVVIPTDGLGTGLAELKTRAPLTLEHIEQWINNLLNPSRDLAPEFAV